MPPTSELGQRLIPPLVGVLILAGLYLKTVPPALTSQELAQVAARYRFEPTQLPDVPGHLTAATVRELHPSLQHIRSWISFVGAGACLADLDADGLPNDIVLTDPRIDRVVVLPAPGTGVRYQPFALAFPSFSGTYAPFAPMGARVGDFNEDGLADILTYYWGRSPVLHLRRAEGLTTATLSAGLFEERELVEPVARWFTSAVTQADIDGDGHLDLYLGNYSADNGRVLERTGPGIEPMMQSMSRASNGGRDRLLLWKGPGATFVALENVLAPEVADGWTFAVGTCDLDGDLRPEVYLANDFGPDRLLHNRSEPGKPRLVPVQGRRTPRTPRSLAVGRDSFNGMGVDFFDLNGDQRPDILVSNISSDRGLHEGNFVFLSNGQTSWFRDGVAPYDDGSDALGLARGGWTWDIKAVDFDNDGRPEIVQGAGYMKGSINRWAELHEVALGNDLLVVDPRFYHRFEPGDDVAGQDHNPFFAQGPDGRYHDIAASIGLGTPMLGRGIAPADVDGDGRIDYVSGNNWEPSIFYRNRSPDPGAFLGLHVRRSLKLDVKTSARKGHPATTTDGPTLAAVGATARVQVANRPPMVATVDGGNGHSGQRAPDLHFGLGRETGPGPVPVEIRWRDGEGNVRSNRFELESGHWHTIVLGEEVGS